jgi:hypothetical protein
MEEQVEQEVEEQVEMVYHRALLELVGSELLILAEVVEAEAVHQVVEQVVQAVQA